MGYKCDHCDKSYLTNQELYSHKENMHRNPTVVLVNHDEHDQTPKEIPSLPPVPSSDGDSDMESIESEMLADIPTPPKPYRKRKGDVIDGGERKKIKVIVDDEGKDYKRLYMKCIKAAKKLISENEKLKHKIEVVSKEGSEKISQYEERVKKANIDCSERILEIEKDIKERAAKVRDDHKIEIDQLESNCGTRLKKLNDIIMDLKNGQYKNFNDLSKIIFNCVTIEEIHRIRELINTNRIDELLNKHMDTLQNIMLGLTVGVIPICNPQRSSINDEQRKLVQDIQDVSTSVARRVVRNKRVQFTRLWSILDDSLKLMCQAYNRYGSHDDGTA